MSQGQGCGLFGLLSRGGIKCDAFNWCQFLLAFWTKSFIAVKQNLVFKNFGNNEFCLCVLIFLYFPQPEFFLCPCFLIIFLGYVDYCHIPDTINAAKWFIFSISILLEFTALFTTWDKHVLNKIHCSWSDFASHMWGYIMLSAPVSMYYPRTLLSLLPYFMETHLICFSPVVIFSSAYFQIFSLHWIAIWILSHDFESCILQANSVFS